MTRQDRGIELLDLNSFTVKLGGRGGNPTDLGIKVSNTLFAPRLGAAYRLNEKTVLRAGYGKTYDPLPWSRPMRGRFPLTIAFTDAGVNGFIPYGSIENGIPSAPSPDLSTGNVPLPRGVDMTTPDPNNSTRGSTQSWNVFFERRLPLDIGASIGYVGTRSDGQYSTLNANYAEFGGNGARQLFAKAGAATINIFASSARARYNSLQLALNRPFKNGLMIKGAYTFSKAMNEVDDDAGGYTWAQPSQFSRNYALANSDRPHMLQVGFVYQLPFARDSSSRGGHAGQELADQRDRVLVVWQAIHNRRRQRTAAAAGWSTDHQSDGSADPGFGKAGPDEPWYDPSLFSQPGNAWGNTGRNQFRGPLTWNLDASIFRTIPFGHYHLELRVESQNVLNHPQWANPVTGFTDPNFMRIRSYARWRTGNLARPAHGAVGRKVRVLVRVV